MLRDCAGRLPAKMEGNAKGTHSRTCVERHCRWCSATFGLCPVFLKNDGMCRSQGPIPMRSDGPPQFGGTIFQGRQSVLLRNLAGPASGIAVQSDDSWAGHHNRGEPGDPCCSQRDALQPAAVHRKPFTTFFSVSPLYLSHLKLSWSRLTLAQMYLCVPFPNA